MHKVDTFNHLLGIRRRYRRVSRVFFLCYSSWLKLPSEPIVYLEVLTPTIYMGSVMELMSTIRNVYSGTDYLGKETALLKYEMPLSEVITDFYDKLKSVSSGYASMSYEPKG